MSSRPAAIPSTPDALAARAISERRPVSAQRCGVCRQPLVDGACPNTVCHFPDRGFSEVLTVSEESDRVWDMIRRYKYDDEKERADELARLLVDYLVSDRTRVERFDLITPCALYIGPRARRLWDYLALILDAAERLDGRWPIAREVITKAVPTGRFLGVGVEERRRIAEGELRAALAVPEPARVAGRRVLVFDDVYSEGFSLREMARVLRQAGAVEVAGLVLCRRKGA